MNAEWTPRLAQPTRVARLGQDEESAQCDGTTRALVSQCDHQRGITEVAHDSGYLVLDFLLTHRSENTYRAPNQ